MFIILCYDIEVKRNAKVRKIACKFLHPVQKSVFEGYITDGKLKKLCAKLKDIIDPEIDSIVIYKVLAPSPPEKLCIGQVNSENDFIL